MKYNHSDEKDDLTKPNLLPYGIVPQAPAIQVPDVDLFKKNKSISVVHHFETRVAEIRKLYEEFMGDIRINDIIYSAEYNFTPLVGKTYHLYKKEEGNYLLSLIEPERWDRFEYVGSYKMGSNDVWEAVEK